MAAAQSVASQSCGCPRARGRDDAGQEDRLDDRRSGECPAFAPRGAVALLPHLKRELPRRPDHRQHREGEREELRSRRIDAIGVFGIVGRAEATVVRPVPAPKRIEVDEEERRDQPECDPFVPAHVAEEELVDELVHDEVEAVREQADPQPAGDRQPPWAGPCGKPHRPEDEREVRAEQRGRVGIGAPWPERLDSSRRGFMPSPPASAPRAGAP